MLYLLSFIRMIIVFSAEIVQIHHIAKSVNFTLISAWVSSKTCKGIN
ncbi:transcriptional regulator, partial [Salmonella enterica]|nr:transcriptional regulator [Salmonella enterica]